MDDINVEDQTKFINCLAWSIAQLDPYLEAWISEGFHNNPLGKELDTKLFDLMDSYVQTLQVLYANHPELFTGLALDYIKRWVEES